MNEMMGKQWGVKENEHDSEQIFDKKVLAKGKKLSKEMKLYMNNISKITNIFDEKESLEKEIMYEVYPEGGHGITDPVTGLVQIDYLNDLVTFILAAD